jgi:adenine deaminase
MATLNPATYAGLDAHLGGIAPGRCADLVVVDSLQRFVPRLVLADGEVVNRSGIRDGGVDWAALPTDPLVAADLDARTLSDVCRSAPAMTLEGVITRAAPAVADGPLPDGACLAALVSRAGTWVSGTVLHGLSVPALASSWTGSRDLLLLGRDPDAMVAAYHRVIGLGGAIVSGDAELPLPVLGRLHDGPLDEVVGRLAGVEAAFGAALPVPLPYLILFLSLSILPDLRLSPLGVVHVKSGTVVHPPTPLVPRAVPLATLPGR